MSTTENLESFLENSEHINWQHPTVLTKAKALAGSEIDQIKIAQLCFEFVRDEI